MIHVCFALYDPYGTYSKYLGTAVCSLFVNVGGAPVTVHILHDDTLSRVNRKRFEHLAQKYQKHLVFHEIDTSAFQSVKHMAGSFTIGTLFRLKIPEVMPETIDRVIYLDCDLIVHLNVSELWNLDMDTYALAACIDEAVESDKGFGSYPLMKKIKETEGRHYFNAGVMVMNLKRIRAMGDFFQTCIGFLREYPKVKFSDQDALNYLLGDQVLYLDKRYNTFSLQLSDVTRDNMDAGIYHFPGDSANWEANRNVDHLFMHYLLLTEWGDGAELYPYLQSWITGEATKVSVLQRFLQRALQEESLHIILFGANSVLLDKVEQLVPRKRMAYILDNNQALQGKKVHGLPVYAPAYLAEERKGTFIVIVMSKKHYDAICRQLSDMGFTENTDFYDARALLSERDGGYYQENRIRGFC